MKKINKGIVFSNDIEMILNGQNAFDYQYEAIPSPGFISGIRKDFCEEVNKIFNGNVTIIPEEAMQEVNRFITGDYPHRNAR